MRTSFFLLVWFGIFLMSFTTGDRGYLRKIDKHRAKLDAEFRNAEESPLREKASEFHGIDYYPTAANYKVTAKLTRTPDAIPFEMPTSNPKIQKKYVSYGILTFELNGNTHQLRVYRSLKLSAMKEYRDHLFLPFTDQTSGNDSYGGGRYLDLTTTKKDKIVIDFNLCYNPYCAYSGGWSCPIPPTDNFLDTRVEAGPKQYADHE